MAYSSLDLRIAAIFIILTSSSLGVALPLLHAKFYLVGEINNNNKIDKEESDLLKCMKACAAGVMLGIALMHLLADAQEDLSQVQPNYNLSYAITSLGIIINLCIEQFVLIYIQSLPNPSHLTSNSDCDVERITEVLSHDEMLISTRTGSDSFVNNAYSNQDIASSREADIGSILDIPVSECEPSYLELNYTAPPLEGDTRQQQALSCDHYQTIDHHNHQTMTMMNGPAARNLIQQPFHREHENELFDNIIKFNNLRSLITLYSMEISVSVHSVIIGVGIGLLSREENLSTLIPLIVAISFHQFVEGLGLGTNIINSLQFLSSIKVISFVIIFALTCPIGIIIGIMTASQPDSVQKTYAKGVTNALAAGSLLYISLAEMVANYFSAPDLIKRPMLKLMMLASFSLGVVILAIVAIWA
jgi:zinc transporter 1/2/3